MHVRIPGKSSPEFPEPTRAIFAGLRQGAWRGKDPYRRSDVRQRFGGALNLNVHFHGVLPDGARDAMRAFDQPAATAIADASRRRP